jgi:hypothetical protein
MVRDSPSDIVHPAESGIDSTAAPARPLPVTWQQRLAEIVGGIKPLAFGQFGEMLGPGLEALLLASAAKRGAASESGPVSSGVPFLGRLLTTKI